MNTSTAAWYGGLAATALTLGIAHLLALAAARRWTPPTAHARSRRLGCIDGLRGYLALLVFAHHYDMTYAWRRGAGWEHSSTVYFKNAGEVGVAVFFLITGFLFTHRLLTQGPSLDWRRLYISRLFRIYPLYLFAFLLIAAGTLWVTGPHLQVVPSRLGYEVTRWLLFKGNTLNGYTDAQLVIGGVAWSLWYEWLFYLSLPLVALLLIRSRALTLLALVAALAVSLHPFKIGSLLDSRLPILFVYGGLVAWLAVHGRISRRFIGHPLVSVLVLCGAAVSLLAFRSIYGLTQMTLLALCFVPIALGNSLFGLLETRASLYLGEISYSIYLVHGAVLFIVFTMLAPHFAGQVSQPLYLLFMPALAPAVVLFSSLTFFAVERPGMAWGKAAAAAAGGRWIWKRPAVVKSHS